jgi:hypothetical protein
LGLAFTDPKGKVKRVAALAVAAAPGVLGFSSSLLLSRAMTFGSFLGVSPAKLKGQLDEYYLNFIEGTYYKLTAHGLLRMTELAFFLNVMFQSGRICFCEQLPT